jgi:hypothetical protein
MNFFLLPIAFIMVGLMLSVFSFWAVGSFVAFVFFYGLERLIVTAGKRLTGLKLRLHPGFFILTEYYGRNPWWRDRGLGKFSAKAIKSAGWTGEGCFIELDRRRAPINHVLLPSGFFRNDESIVAMELWARTHGIEIEGVKPLPGAYVRTTEAETR